MLDSYKKGNITVLTMNGSPIAYFIDFLPEDLEKLISFVNKSDLLLRTIREREKLNKLEYDRLVSRVNELTNLLENKA